MPLFSRIPPHWRGFIAAFVIALCFALFTRHIWEDYYITYRASKNLATGHGLVFNHGDRLHTFTSPLGVLLPALSSLLTGNRSDDAALWIFRLMSISAFAGSVAILIALARRLDYPVWAVSLLGALAILDAKSLDFTINGMETGFILLFTAYALWACFRPGPRQWLHLGAAWAGMMWSRPDSFLYIALLAASIWLFNNPKRTGHTRRRLVWLYLQAGLATTALYLPWFAWAWWYYGTPVPHTISAKGLHGGETWERIKQAWQLPWAIWQGRTAVEGAFLPSYYMFPAWPSWMFPWGRALGTLCSFLWLVPWVRAEVRAASFVFCGGVVFLSFVPYFPFPWYFPTVTLFGFVALAGLAAQLLDSGKRFYWSRGLVAAGTACLLLGSLWLTLGTARQARAQQLFIEDGNRRLIGEWLRENAEPGDTVFMEPLGYIGFFSNLKTYDWPGMSSREVVNAVRYLGPNWRDLINYLQPNWLVLRPDSEHDLGAISPLMAHYNYERVREFSRIDDIRQLNVSGKKLLEFDARFAVYRRKNPLRHDTADYEIASPIGSSVRHIDGVEMRMVHAPGLMLLPVPEGARQLTINFAIAPEAIAGSPATDGAWFKIHWSDGRRRETLPVRALDPVNNERDRGVQQFFQIDLPKAAPGALAKIILETDPKGDTAQDWTFWGRPEFHY